MVSNTRRRWLSYPALRQQQFAAFINGAAQPSEVIDTVVEKILLRRDEFEKLLLKNLLVQIALYAGLVVTPVDGSFSFFGVPFKAGREVMLFLLAFANIIAIFVASKIKLQNEFIAVWQNKKFANQLMVAPNLAYGSNLIAGSWYPPPTNPLRRTRTATVLTLVMALAPPIILLLMPVVGFAIGVVASIDIWHHPSLPPAIAKATIVFYLFSYLLNLTYALADTIPLPYRD